MPDRRPQLYQRIGEPGSPSRVTKVLPIFLIVSGIACKVFSPETFNQVISLGTEFFNNLSKLNK